MVGVFAVYAAPVVLSGASRRSPATRCSATRSIHFLALDRIAARRDATSARWRLGVPQTRSRPTSAAGYPVGAQPARRRCAASSASTSRGSSSPSWLCSRAGLTRSRSARAAACAPAAAARARASSPRSRRCSTPTRSRAASRRSPRSGSSLLVAALLPDWRAAAPTARARVIPLAVASARRVNILSLAIAAWLGPLLLDRARRCRSGGARLRGAALARSVGCSPALGAVLSIPALRELGSFVDTTTTVVTGQAEFGNLLRPLDRCRAWASGSRATIRLPLSGDDLSWTYALLGVAAVALVALGGVGRRGARAGSCSRSRRHDARRRALHHHRGSPWADAKALAISSPMLLLGVMLGAASLVAAPRSSPGRWPACWPAASLVSNALAYHSVVLAPYDRLEELRSVGERLRGPAVRRRRSTSTTSPSTSCATLASGGRRRGARATSTRFRPTSPPARPLIVRRRGPALSRPPSSFDLAWPRALLRGLAPATGCAAGAAPRAARRRLQRRSRRRAAPRCARSAAQARRDGGSWRPRSRQRRVVMRPSPRAASRPAGASTPTSPRR